MVFTSSRRMLGEQMMHSSHLFTNIVEGTINQNKSLRYCRGESSKWCGDVDTLDSSVSVDQSHHDLSSVFCGAAGRT